jgi:hypothetical protein
MYGYSVGQLLWTSIPNTEVMEETIDLGNDPWAVCVVIDLRESHKLSPPGETVITKRSKEKNLVQSK